MKQCAHFFAFLFLAGVCAVFCSAQSQGPASETVSPKAYSGMYSFLKDGEFVQLTVEDDGSVTGFISRFGDSDSDKDAFLNQFFKTAKIDGTHLEFTTKTVHGVWYEFSGTTETVAGTKSESQGARVLRGTLKVHSVGLKGADNVKSRDVVFKSFPSDV
jgi:hypothetical protein